MQDEYESIDFWEHNDNQGYKVIRQRLGVGYTNEHGEYVIKALNPQENNLNQKP